MYGLPPTFETAMVLWMHNRLRWLWSSPDEGGNNRLSRGKLGFWSGIVLVASVIALL